jgi:hypothetical protein
MFTGFFLNVAKRVVILIEMFSENIEFSLFIEVCLRTIKSLSML